jgi:hypothetical protein
MQEQASGAALREPIHPFAAAVALSHSFHMDLPVTVLSIQMHNTF